MAVYRTLKSIRESLGMGFKESYYFPSKKWTSFLDGIQIWDEEAGCGSATSRRHSGLRQNPGSEGFLSVAGGPRQEAPRTELNGPLCSETSRTPPHFSHIDDSHKGYGMCSSGGGSSMSLSAQ